MMCNSIFPAKFPNPTDPTSLGSPHEEIESLGSLSLSMKRWIHCSRPNLHTQERGASPPDRLLGSNPPMDGLT